MNKVSFKNFINENDVILGEITKILGILSEDELQELAVYLLLEFTDVTEEELADVYFEIDDLIDIIKEMGVDNYPIILDLLTYNELSASTSEYSSHHDNSDYINDVPVIDTTIDISSFDIGLAESEEINELYARVMKPRDFKRKRTFFGITKSGLAKNKAANRIKYIKKKAKVQRALKINKQRIQKYRKSREKAIKNKKHIVQHHRGVSGY